jgi:hypothetical protein
MDAIVLVPWCEASHAVLGAALAGYEHPIVFVSRVKVV